jgi:hypothetical protein
MKARNISFKLFAMMIALSALVAIWTKTAIAQTSRSPTKVVVPSSEFPTIQRGIDAIADNGTVLIYPGLYEETLTVLGKRVNIVGSGARGERRTEIAGARPTEVVPIDRASSLITYGAGGGGELKGIMLRGSDAGILGKEFDGEFPADLVVKDMVIQEGGRGIAGKFSSFTVKDTEISYTLSNGISLLVQKPAQLSDLFIHDVKGVGALIFNFNEEATVGPTINSSLFVSNAAGGLVIVGEAKPVTINNCLFIQNNGFGILLLQTGSVTINTVFILDTGPRDDGFWGDGLSAVLSCNVITENSTISGSARAGISNFGSTVSLKDVLLQCNPININGEVLMGNPFKFEDLGGVECGCNSVYGQCVASSSVLMPPEQPDP